METSEAIRDIRQHIHATNDPASAYAVLKLIEIVEGQQREIHWLMSRSWRCRDAGFTPPPVFSVTVTEETGQES